MMLYRSLLEKLFLPLGDRLNGSSFMGELKTWRSVQTLDETAIQQQSRANLNRLLTHATANIPYYKEKRFIKDGNDPVQWLKKFPVIKKHDIKKDLMAFVDPKAKGLIPYESSGSSGIQGKVFMNKTEQSVIRAIMMLWWEWAGYHMDHPMIQTGMTPQRGLLKSVKDFLFRTRYYVAFGLDDQTIKTALQSFEKGNYRHMAGYASSLYLFAKVAEAEKFDIKFDSVISWGDKMFAHYRKQIERAFHTNVFDTYACNEGIMIAAQHDLEYYYIMSPHVHVEIIDAQGNEVPDGELGYVVVTRLDNFSMPLIRYYNGDLAVKLPREKYPAQRKLGFPLLERIIGRDTDIVRTRSGKYLIVHFFTGIFEFYPTIRQFRVVQKDPDSIVVEYIPEPGFHESVLKEITDKIHDFLKEPFPINYVKVDNIPPTASGKPQIIKSELKS